jgi:hypothetical protein
MAGRPLSLVLGAGLLLAVAGCETARPVTPPPAAVAGADAVGELRGTWTGTWAGTPLTLLVVEHTESAPYSGFYFGPWLVSGGRYPGIDGVMTYLNGRSATTVRFNGWIHSSRPFSVALLAEPPGGQLYMRLNGAGAGVLIGEGSSTFSWVPHGTVQLTRRRRP